jgi:cytochrome c551/c552
MIQTADAIFNVGTCDFCHAEVEQEFGPKPVRLRTVEVPEK